MAKEAVDKIIKAETKASEILSDASKEAAQMSKKAALDAQEYLQNIREKANAEYDSILSEAKKKAAEFADGAAKQDDAESIALGEKIKKNASRVAEEISKML